MRLRSNPASGSNSVATSVPAATAELTLQATYGDLAGVRELAAALTGALATLSLPPFDQAWACWLALTPLLAAIWFSGDGVRRRVRRGLCRGRDGSESRA